MDERNEILGRAIRTAQVVAARRPNSESEPTRKMRQFLSLLATAATLLAWSACADLPSHCLKWQVLGTWDFKVSAAQKGSPLCGHTRPDDIVSVYVNGLGYDNPGFNPIKQGNFTLLSNYSDNAILCFDGTCEPAKWTMVYDEAMAIKGTHSDFELLFQFVYVPRDKSNNGNVPDPKKAALWNTYCDRTYPGWYMLSRETRGCVVAKNRVSLPPQPSLPVPGYDTEANALVQMKSGIRLALEQTFRAEFLQQRSFDYARLEEEASLINQRQRFWVADASSAAFTRGFTNREALASVGGFKEKLLKPRSYSLDSILDPVARAKEKKRRECVRKVLPETWDWSKSPIGSTPVINQGSCGSCYAVSSADAFTSRIRIKRQSASFGARSATAILACSPTNQGCDGGFPWLVAHHGHYEGLYSDACAGPYATNPPQQDSPLAKCDFSAPECKNDREFVRAWGYVGGYYGRGNTEDMMWSLFRDGPLVVAVNARSDLFMYRSGLFVAGPVKVGDEVKAEEAYWQATTHAVSMVGWGNVEVESDKIESWRIKNSWGTNWGESGYFNIQRGVDSMAVESMPVHAIFGDGKPGNPEFESTVKTNLAKLNDPECTEYINAMLQKELV